MLMWKTRHFATYGEGSMKNVKMKYEKSYAGQEKRIYEVLKELNILQFTYLRFDVIFSEIVKRLIWAF